MQERYVEMPSTDVDYRRRSTWDCLVFGVYGRTEIDTAVDWTPWQLLRISMKGQSLGQRYARLHNFLSEQSGRGNGPRAKIVITNYVHALSRGGMIKTFVSDVAEEVLR